MWFSEAAQLAHPTMLCTPLVLLCGASWSLFFIRLGINPHLDPGTRSSPILRGRPMARPWERPKAGAKARARAIVMA